MYVQQTSVKKKKKEEEDIKNKVYPFFPEAI